MNGKPVKCPAIPANPVVAATVPVVLATTAVAVPITAAEDPRPSKQLLISFDKIGLFTYLLLNAV